MVKPEWGTKRTCPQTGVRFYDLGKDNPVTSPSGYQWHPEPVLKSKQPIPYEEVQKAKPEPVPDSDLGDEDLEIDEDEEASADNDVDLGGEDDLGVAGREEDDEH